MTISKQTKTAIVGVSQNPEKYGHRIFKDLKQDGYDVVGVNPKGGEVDGEKIYKSLQELSRVPELVITVVPPFITEKVVQECVDLGVKQIWMQPGSESETAIELAKKNDLEVISNACFMKQEKVW